MKDLFITLMLVMAVSVCAQENKAVLDSIKNNDLLNIGGCDLIKVGDKDFIAGVSAVEVGTKKISSLVRVGKVKAEKEVVTFVNGAEITSKTESYIKEELVTVNNQQTLKTADVFVESIRENAEGFVKQMKPAGYWYSDDKSVFYYAVYKAIDLQTK